MLTVLSVAYPFAAISLDPVGGAEQIVSALDRALVDAGHRSLVLGQDGSRVQGSLVPIAVEPGPLTPERRSRALQRCRQSLLGLLRTTSVDLIHFHGCDCAQYIAATDLFPDVPKLVTLHLPLEWYEPGLFRSDRGLLFNCVSDWQRRDVQGRARVHATIENGVDLARWYPEALPSGAYAACLGRICPEKGFDRALRAAHAAGLPLLLAGQVFDYPEHRKYFEDSIRPLLDRQRRFLGPVSGEAKRRLLADAACVLVPSRVAETSSLVVMEALACGTPVIVSGAGAPSSLIEPDRTGFVADDEAEIAAALPRVIELRRDACRQTAERRFDLNRTVREYLALYTSLQAERAA